MNTVFQYFYSSSIIIVTQNMLQYNTKSTHLIIHKNIQYALQASQEELSRKQNVQLGPINSQNKRQLWLLQGQKGGSFEIVNGFTDQVMTQNGEQIILKRGAGNKHQTWIFQFISQKEFFIKLAKSKSKYLCIQSGTLVFRQIKKPITPDVWIIKPVLDNPVLNKTCFIISSDTKKLIDIPQATPQQGSQILIYEPNYRYNQRWNIYRAGQIYVIKSFFNEMNLDVFQERFQHLNKVIQWPSHGKVNQFWLFQKVGDSQYRIATFYDRQFQLGHHHGSLVIHKGRKFTWHIEGYFPA